MWGTIVLLGFQHAVQLFLQVLLYTAPDVAFCKFVEVNGVSKGELLLKALKIIALFDDDEFEAFCGKGVLGTAIDTT